MTAIERTWCRILARRLGGCVERFEGKLAVIDRRASLEAWVAGEWGDDLDAWEAFRAVQAPYAITTLTTQLAESRDDLATVVAGELPAWTATVLPNRRTHCRWEACGLPRRRHIPLGELRRFPLTQPPNVCQSCGYEADQGGNLDLDHLAELVFGGADHAFNLIRVCYRCHRSKPIWPDEPPAVQRILALEFYGIAA